ncbi:MAG: TIGR00153 family protein [Actinobacteria bacterium]|nr:TIGR00153 family protein [Actinomycetota bacterium]
MKEIYNIFTKSPFGILNDHIIKVGECVKAIRPLLAHMLNEEFDQLPAAMKVITKLEHEADELKDEVREHLPKSIFMPVSREDVLKLLHRQDNIADFCEDIAVITCVRNTTLPKSMHPMFNDFVDSVIITADATVAVIRRLNELMETTFTGPSAEEVLKNIEKVGKLEWETDKKKFELVKQLFEHEDEIGPVSTMILTKLFDVISGVADSSENAANAIRLMISK